MSEVRTESPSSALAASRQRALARMRAVIVLAFALPLVGLGVAAVVAYRDAFHEARERLETATRIAQEHAQKMLETNEMLLERMLDHLGPASDAEILARGEELHERLKRMTRDLPQVQGFFAIGADGRMLVTNRAFPPPRHIDFSDREFLAAHRDGREGRVFITGYLVSRVTGDAFFDMSRRRAGPGGAYAGTVNVALYPAYLTRFWEEMERTLPGLRVSLLRADGRFIARNPGLPADGATLGPDHPLVRHMNGGATSGVYESVSGFDGVAHLVAFRKLGEHPAYVATGLSRGGIVAGWAWRVALLALFVVPLACALAWMAWLALKRTRDELEAVQRLEDETARRQRGELVLAQSQKLETVGQLAGGVAHDFNNLLMIVGNNLHLLRRRVPQGADKELGAIERAVSAGARLTRQLLSLSGRQALAPERLVLQERLPALLALVRPALPGTLELQAAAAPDTAPVFLDAAELELALINLALNARDAMPGGGRLAVSARNEGREVIVEVRDTGGGIDPAIVARVTEPFFTTKAPGKGTGLGLTQVHALCRAAGGRMEIVPAPGGGTCVRLFFPTYAAEPAGQREGVAGLRPAALRCELLLVDDNDALAQVTAEVLESLGCTVRRAENARVALQAVEEQRFDVVLSDIEMPGQMDGIELASRLGARRPPLPTVLMSGYAARIDQARSLGLEVLAKPCSPAVLQAAIAAALTRHANAAAA